MKHATSRLLRRVKRNALIAMTLIISSQAGAGVINADAFGNYILDGGSILSGTTSYATGGAITFGPDFEARSFFTFTPTTYSNITSATLRIYLTDMNSPTNPFGPYGSSDPTETFTVFDVSTPTGTLISGTGGLAAFNDLGSGTAFGSATVSESDEGSFVEVVLSGDALSELNAANGKWSIGGALTSLDGGAPIESIFLNSQLEPNVQLVVDGVFIPAPAPFALILLAFGVMVSQRTRAG